MPVTIKNLTKEAIRKHDNAARKALAASADRLVLALQKAHGSYYLNSTAEKGRTGQVRNSIRRNPVYKTEEGYEVQVGTKLLFPLFWELGHYNIFTKRYERVRIWEPTGQESAKDMREVYARVYKSLIDG